MAGPEAMCRRGLLVLSLGASLLGGAGEVERCADGVMNHNFVCCAASCGECGGPGCDVRPGGSAMCCGGAIRQPCRTAAGPPPCIYWEEVARGEARQLGGITAATSSHARCPAGSSLTPLRDFALCTRDEFDLVDRRLRDVGEWEDCEMLPGLARAIGGKLRVLDAGAHIGACALPLAVAGHMVAAVEPHRRSFDSLNASVQFNRLAAAEGAASGLVEVHNVALTERRGHRLMWEKTRNSAASVALPEAQDPQDFVARSGHTDPSVPAGIRQQMYANASWAVAVPLDDLRIFGSRPPRAFDLVKLDINGGELGLLRGARLAFSVPPLIVKFEFWPSVLRAMDSDPLELLRFFLERLYDLWVLDGGRGGMDSAYLLRDDGASLLNSTGAAFVERYTDIVAVSRLRWPARSSLKETLAL